MCIIKLKNVYKEYHSGVGSVKALDGVSLEINNGDFVAITGTSGSGKTTLLNILGGIDKVTRGDVFYKKSNIKKYKDLSEYRRNNVGFIFQFFNLVPILTVEENICLPLIINGKSVSKNKLDEVINKLNLDKKRNILPNRLSGGEQQRTAIGRAIISQPLILLADEPTGNLDSQNTEKVMHLLNELNQEGQTIVIVTHDEYITKYCNRKIVLADGKIITDYKLSDKYHGR
jgi:putative ABC transport system ATP-binding protein